MSRTHMSPAAHPVAPTGAVRVRCVQVKDALGAWSKQLNLTPRDVKAHVVSLSLGMIWVSLL
jgi:hypothetical protein